MPNDTPFNSNSKIKIIFIITNEIIKYDKINLGYKLIVSRQSNTKQWLKLIQ